MENQTPMLQLVDICKTFPGVKALQNIRMDVKKGEVRALIGENGAGKSTLIKVLSGAYTKDSGEIYIDGQHVNITSTAKGKELGISVIYQELSLIRQLNAVENLYLGNLERKKGGLVDWKIMKMRAREIFSRIGLECNLTVPVKKLSIAQCQLIEISRAIVRKAKIIVMDEPTSSLTESEIEHLFNLIHDLKKQNITIIYITHKLDELFRVADTVSVLKDGCNANEFVVLESTKEQWVYAMVGRELGNYYPPHTSTRGKAVLEAKNISYDKIFKDVSFTAYSGEILGFAGLIGAGRTELMMSIFGAFNKVDGEVYLNGKKVKYNHPRKAIRDGIALAPEDRKNQGLILCLSIAKNITLAKMRTVANKFNIINLKKETNITKEYINKLDIMTTSTTKKVSELSGGNQQKIIIGKWINTNASIYIFDEPTRGIDVGSKAQIYHMLRDLADEGNVVILISSEMPEVLGVSDRILVMHEGKIIEEFYWQEATEQKIIAAAVGGIVC